VHIQQQLSLAPVREQEARKAIMVVRELLSNGSNFQSDGRHLTVAEERALSTTVRNASRRAVESVLSQDRHISKEEAQVHADIEALEECGYGRCGEQASAAFVVLMNLGIRPLDIVHTTIGYHAVVVIGRRPDSDPLDSATWGPNAVVCCPWSGKVYRLYEFAALQRENKLAYTEAYRHVFKEDNAGIEPPPPLAGRLVSVLYLP
jgi:hypothetical protein